MIKNRMKRLSLFVAIGLSVLIVIPLKDVSAAEISLVYASESPPQTFPVVTANKWAEVLKERTNGRAGVRVFSGGALLSAGNMFDGVHAGVADIGQVAVSYDPGRFPLLSLAGAVTGLNVSSSVASQAVYDLTQIYSSEQLGFNNFKILTAFTSEPGRIHSKGRVDSLENLKGLELRVPGDSAAVLRELGAVPVGLSMPETGEALQTGVISGYVGSRETLMDLRFARTAKHVVDYPLTNVVFVVVMRQDRWDSLPSAVQRVIEEMGSEIAGFAGGYLDGRVKESLEWSGREESLNVVTLTEDESGRWDEKLQPLLDARITAVDKMGLPGSELVATLRDRIAHHQLNQ